MFNLSRVSGSTESGMVLESITMQIAEGMRDSGLKIRSMEKGPLCTVAAMYMKASGKMALSMVMVCCTTTMAMSTREHGKMAKCTEKVIQAIKLCKIMR
jgi:hypothetical protein